MFFSPATSSLRGMLQRCFTVKLKAQMTHKNIKWLHPTHQRSQTDLKRPTKDFSLFTNSNTTSRCWRSVVCFHFKVALVSKPPSARHCFISLTRWCWRSGSPADGRVRYAVLFQLCWYEDVSLASVQRKERLCDVRDVSPSVFPWRRLATNKPRKPL